MSDLYVVGFRDVATAEEARNRLIKLQQQHLIVLNDIVVVENNDGKIKLKQATNTTGAGAIGGAVWGGLIGLLFFMPLVGMAIGAGTGAVGGALTDIGINDDFMKQLGTTLKPGSAAVFMLVAQATQDKVIPEITDLGGVLLQSSLSAEAEQHLREAVQNMQK